MEHCCCIHIENPPQPVQKTLRTLPTQTDPEASKQSRSTQTDDTPPEDAESDVPHTVLVPVPSPPTEESMPPPSAVIPSQGTIQQEAAPPPVFPLPIVTPLVAEDMSVLLQSTANGFVPLPPPSVGGSDNASITSGTGFRFEQ